jgi:DNA-binding transcriptional regulator GbsR (MarR family)
MIRFGNIKSKFESLFVESYKTDSFSDNLKFFRDNIISNKTLSESYYIYDEIYKGKGFDKTKGEQYLTETTRILRSRLSSEQDNLTKINEWLDSKINNEVKNIYEDLDNQIYDVNDIRKVEDLIESKNTLLNTLSTKTDIVENKSFNIPLSSALKITNKKLNEHLSQLDEGVISELKNITSLSKKDLVTEIDETRNEVIKKLEGNLSSSNDEELKTKITETINKLNNSKYSYLTLYTIKELNEKI